MRVNSKAREENKKLKGQLGRAEKLIINAKYFWDSYSEYADDEEDRAMCNWWHDEHKKLLEEIKNK
jgi:hypothetical protein